MSQNDDKRSPANTYYTHILPRLDEIRQMVEEGKSERAIAAEMGVAFCTIRRHRKKHTELDAALTHANKWETNIRPNLAKIPEMAVTMTQGQIAEALGVSRSSWDNYKAEHPELVAALDKGKEKLVQELKDALRQKALGFRYDETKTTQRKTDGQTQVTIEKYDRYSPPDIGAIHLLLKNNDPEWRNDDYETMKLKQKQVEIAQQKADDQTW